MALFPFIRLLYSSAKCSSNTKGCFNNSVRNLMSKQLVYESFGDPLKVVKFRERSVPELESTEVLVRMLAAPVNPADMNTIQGKYPVKVELPAVPGNEGVGVIEDVGNGVQGLEKGKKVIITKPVQGTWRDLAIFSADVLRAVPDELGVVEAATLTVNPCTAYRMLTDFVPVKEKGLVVIQNGANSACGQNVIQICKAWGIKNINIVRNRPDISDLKKYLESLGATYVLTEEELRSTTIFKDKQINKPSLALNCVGGKNSLEMLRHLQHSGKMVTYGGMSREPVTIPTSAFIFKNLSFYGFWMTAWNEKASKEDKEKMMDEIISLMCSKKVRGPVHKMVKFDEYEEALKNALTTQGFTGCNEALRLPNLPSVPGDEGVGNVVEVGNSVTTVKVGQRVILATRLLGSWRYYGIFQEKDLFVLAPTIPIPEASMLAIAPCTAYRMIKDFRDIQPGETLVQNAANSPVGQSVIQLCKANGINTLNIVASHCGLEATKEHLYSLGANCVCTIEQAENWCKFDTTLQRPIIALNCLGGRYENVLLRLLKPQGTIVYYGCAYDVVWAKKTMFPDINFHRFLITEWEEETQAANICPTMMPVEKTRMLRALSEQIVLGKFKALRYEPVELKNYVHALRNTVDCEAYSTFSYIFDLTLP